jgi:sec-independent protein translocase protein TatB
MFGIDSPELLVIAIVALVVIGPKELPGLLRTWGKWMGQMRGMAAEFRGHVDEMVRQSELDEVKKQLESTPGLDLQSLDPTKQIRSAIQEGMAEGEKAMAEAKATFDNPLAEPESAPQIAADVAPAAGELPAPSQSSGEAAPVQVSPAEPSPAAPVAGEAPAPAAAVAPPPERADAALHDNPAKAAAG